MGSCQKIVHCLNEEKWKRLLFLSTKIIEKVREMDEYKRLIRDEIEHYQEFEVWAITIPECIKIIQELLTKLEFYEKSDVLLAEVTIDTSVDNKEGTTI